MKTNTVTQNIFNQWIQERYEELESLEAPDFFSTFSLNAEGVEADSEPATFVEFWVEDYDNKHDFSYLEATLEKLGVILNREEMLNDYDLMLLERDGAPLPLKAADLTGSGSFGNTYGFRLILE